MRPRKNIEIPDELKGLEYRNFKFDVPTHGAITFKIMFEPGVLPDVFPQVRERKTRRPEGRSLRLRPILRSRLKKRAGL